MAVYTYLTDTQLQIIAETYGFAAITQAIPIAEGVENSNYLIYYEKAEGLVDKAILTVFEKRIAAAEVPFYLRLKQHLHANGIPCPLPYMTANSDLFMTLEAKQLAIVSFLEGKSIMQPESEHVAQAGEMLARMHLAAENFSMTRHNAMSFAGWETLLQRIQAATRNNVAETQYLLAAEEYAFQCEHFPRNLPEGIIHADLFPNNVFFNEKGQLSGVIDFYFACHDAFAYDVAILANAWCFNEGWQWQADAFAALMEGYQRCRSLSIDELQAMPVLLRAAAMRFLLTRLHDVLYHNEAALVIPHNPQEYAEKLIFHQCNNVILF